jgi:RecB family exonuclease
MNTIADSQDGMNVRLGLHIDGQHGAAFRAQLDSLTTGPLGMLSVLETQLGLLRLEVPNSDRVLQYADVLKRLDSPARFYHVSFSVDALGTAATLLNWRDQWHLHGWTATTPEVLLSGEQPRLHDMSEIEVEATRTLAPAIGERLALISTALKSTKARIGTVVLCEPLESWPLAWRSVLSQLSISFDGSQTVRAKAGTMLAEIQQALLSRNSNANAPKIRWRDDGSVSALQAESPLLAASWVADQLRDRDAQMCEQVLLCAPDAALLDDVIVAANLPRQGFRESSPFRPALQVLPLVLSQMWLPTDIYGLLQFLTHPICPVPALARTRLAEMLARTPGIGSGPVWESTLQRIETACEETGKDWTSVRERIRIWIEHTRFDPSSGITLVALTDRLKQLASYFQGRLLDKDAAKQMAFTSALSQTLTMQRSINALALQGETHIGVQPLQTLLLQATAQGSFNPAFVAQVGACRTVTQPGGAIDAAKTVFWWQLAAPASTAAYPWSVSELKTLRKAGVDLPDLNETMSQEAMLWQRPVLAATDHLKLVLPAPGVEVHPLWLLLESLFEKGFRPQLVALDRALTDSSLVLVPPRPLPERKRWWELPEDVAIDPRASESYSSLESYLFNPYVWVLRYPAKLSPSSILDVSEGVLLYGNLSHHLVERCLQQKDALTQPDAAFEAWFDPEFENLVAQEGAVLQMPGRREELATFRRKLLYSMRQLRVQLRAADVTLAVSEEKLEGQFSGGSISGSCDLLLTRKDGQQAILDLKWGSKTYQSKLEENRHLQLAIYGEVVRQRIGNWPRLAYFSLGSGELLATDNEFFPKAKLVRKEKLVAEEGAAHLWQRFLKTWAWRREQIDRGRIEVVLEPHEDELPPDEALAIEVLNPNYNKYLSLAGWEKNQ